ncbi:AraC-like ligand-binding domain-containing protein [Streptomyces capparidis]
MFRSEDFPPGERLARFDGFQAGCAHPMRVLGAAPGGFRATARVLVLADVHVMGLTCSPAELWCAPGPGAPRAAGAARPEPSCSVVLALRGELGVSQAGRETVLGAHDFAVCDGSRPFRVRLAARHGTAALVRAQVPRALLPLPGGGTGRLLGRRLSGREGVGALLAQFLGSLVSGSASYRPADAPRLGVVALELLTAALAHQLDAGPRVPEDSRRRVLRLRVRAFIQRHLGDPELNPRTIAAAHHISLSYLHRIFEGEDDTVAASIRRQRLERARRDLSDPAQRAVPVHAIAARWGFPRATDFSRAFRTAYGVPPTAYRHGAHALVDAVSGTGQKPHQL